MCVWEKKKETSQQCLSLAAADTPLVITVVHHFGLQRNKQKWSGPQPCKLLGRREMYKTDSFNSALDSLIASERDICSRSSSTVDNHRPRHITLNANKTNNGTEQVNWRQENPPVYVLCVSKWNGVQGQQKKRTENSLSAQSDRWHTQTHTHTCTHKQSPHTQHSTLRQFDDVFYTTLLHTRRLPSEPTHELSRRMVTRTSNEMGVGRPIFVCCAAADMLICAEASVECSV